MYSEDMRSTFIDFQPECFVEMLEKIWDEILIFAPYAFNKSHAVAYTWISYCMGYLKVHFPHDYNTKYYEQI